MEVSPLLQTQLARLYVAQLEEEEEEEQLTTSRVTFIFTLLGALTKRDVQRRWRRHYRRECAGLGPGDERRRIPELLRTLAAALWALLEGHNNEGPAARPL